MQRKSGHSGHSVITPASTSRANGAPRLPTARERRTMMAPNPHELTLAKLSAILEATKPQPRLGAESDQSPVNQARMQDILALMLSLPP